MDINILKASIVRISDGDTIVCNIRWLDMSKTTRVRMASMYAPELSNPDGSGIAARDYLKTLLPDGLQVFIQCHILDSYGRPLGTIYLSPRATKSDCLNCALFSTSTKLSFAPFFLNLG